MQMINIAICDDDVPMTATIEAILAIKMKWRCVIWQAAKRKILQQQFWEK